MRIFQVVPYYPPHVGGMEVYVDYLSARLACKGHEVTVFTSSDKNYSYHHKVNGVDIRRIKVSTKLYNIPIANTLLTALMKEEKPDVIDAHQYPIYFSDISALTSKIRKIPLFLHVHVIPDPKSPVSAVILKSYYNILERFTIHASKCIIAPSEMYRKLLIALGVDARRIAVVPYGIDLQKFYPNLDSINFKKNFNLEGSKVILTVGRLNYQKGFHYLIEAMPKILHQIPHVKLVIVGDGELMPYLKNLAISLGLKGKVIFAGAMPQTLISQAYAAADVFVLPSLFESFGISLLEAQAMEKPVVGTRAGGIPEAMADGKSGILVEAKNPAELSGAILRLLRDQNLSISMGKNGRKFVLKHYDLEKSIDCVLSCYQKA